MAFQKSNHRVALALALACTLSLTGCSNEAEQKLTEAQSQITLLQQENQKLQQEITRLKAEKEAQEAAKAQADAKARADAPAQFTDIAGNLAEPQIQQLAKLEVFDTMTGQFNPSGTITRAELFRWLVRKQQKTERNPLRLAEGGTATFTDVPPTHPDFKYIQGLANAGYVVGFDATTFRPDEIVTREMLLAIIPSMHETKGETREYFFMGNIKSKYTDYAKFSKRYLPFIYYSGGLSDKVFGPVKILNPQTPVTRAEAAIAVSEASYLNH
jgi:outer membrane murein-binding lipoprotein Lpp